MTDIQDPVKEVKETTEVQAAKQSVFGCAAHPDQRLKMVPYTKASALNCKSCGVKLCGTTGYLACQANKQCFNICSNCRVCRSNHFLGRIYTLKNFENNPLYSKNKFNCQGCVTEKEVPTEGVYHCGTCDFTVCMDCIRKEDRLWS